LKRILLIQTAFTGDVVLATPVAEKLHQYYPEAEIDFLLRKGNEGLLKNHPFIREVLILDKKNKLRSLWTLFRKIRKVKYDLIVNMHRFGSSGVLVAFSGAKEKVGFDKNPFAWSYTRALPHEIGTGKHEVKRNLELVAHLTDLHTQSPKLYPAESDYKHISFQQKQGAYITMSPSSVWFTKQWHAKKWVELVRLIPNTYQIYLLGGPADANYCEAILRDAGREHVANMAGHVSFLQSAALMQGAKMNYVNDSAPMHFASAMNAPVTAIYCSTVPSFGFGPLSENSRVVEVEEKLPCRPCGLHGHADCPELHFKCALNIEAKKVMGEI
jgi:ADP-heptose:LPS heptosyltransferase